MVNLNQILIFIHDVSQLIRNLLLGPCINFTLHAEMQAITQIHRLDGKRCGNIGQCGGGRIQEIAECSRHDSLILKCLSHSNLDFSATLEIQKDIVHNSFTVNISRNKLLHFIDDRVCFISVGSLRSVREILQCPERCARLGNSGAHITATFGFCCNLCIGQIYNVFNVIAEVLERDTAGR